MSENTESTYQIQGQTVEHLKSFIESMKAEKQSEYIRKIRELEDELKRLKKSKRYGLVWEDKPEEIVDRCKKELPVLVEDETKQIAKGGDDPTHILIEGDNYQALSVLAYTHEKKVDVIYIDPPYNTGDKDFRYNDTFVDSDDTFRHSKWLSFINKRILLAKGLLSDAGVLYISIDDNEQAPITMLCREIFGEKNVDIMIWRKSGEGRDGKMKNTTTFRKDHEYIITCWKNEKVLNKILEKPNFQKEYNNTDNDTRGPWLSGSISRADYASNENHKNYYSVVSPSGITITRQFEISKEEFNQMNSEERISWGKTGDSIPRLKIFINEMRSITPYSLLLSKGTTSEGTKEASEIVGFDLTNLRPKPRILVKTLIQLGSNQNSLILDFFAGSGTTGHAVLELNKEDGWNRQCILCTNNENKIAEEVTYPRIKNVINGYADVPGIPANLRYYRTDFVPMQASMDDLRRTFVDRCTEMLCIREDCFHSIKDSHEMIRIFSGLDKHLVILYDPFELQNLRSVLEKTEGDISLYIFSLSPEIFIEELNDFGSRVHIETIPDPILETYKVIFGF